MSTLTDTLTRRIRELEIVKAPIKKDPPVPVDIIDIPPEKKSRRGGRRPGAGRKEGKTAADSRTLGYRVPNDRADAVDAAIRQMLLKRFKINLRTYNKKP